jgi:hypothetical protein
MDTTDAVRHALTDLGDMGNVLGALRALRPSGMEGGNEPRMAIMLDSPSSGKVMHQIFGKFRDELWQLPYTWVLSIQQDMRGALLTPPADAFFEEEIELEPLTVQQQEELIARRLGPGRKGKTTPWRLSSPGENSPRRLLQIVRDSVRTGEPFDQQRQAMAKRHGRAERLGSAALALYEDLEEFGPASASDPNLLDRMGWSRQRAAQVLAELEQADLVRAEIQHGSGGRPRKVFAALSPPSA